MEFKALYNMVQASCFDGVERIRRLPTESYIPTKCYSQVLDAYIENGWRVVYGYDGPDAGIDYNRTHLKRGKSLLRFSWWPDEGGRVAGSKSDIEEISRYIRDHCA
ncbi:hypothetical protein ACWFRF_09585 [Nocardia sp. NPDC055165]